MNTSNKQGKAPAAPSIGPMVPSRVIDLTDSAPMDANSLIGRTRPTGPKSVGGSVSAPPRKTRESNSEEELSSDPPSLEDDIVFEAGSTGKLIPFTIGDKRTPEYADATTDEEIARAVALVEELRKLQSLNGLSIKIIKGSAPDKFFEQDDFWIMLDFGSKTTVETVVTLELRGLPGGVRTFRGATHHFSPRGKRRGGSSLAVKIKDLYPNSFTIAPARSGVEFGIIDFKDRLNTTPSSKMDGERDDEIVNGDNEEAYSGDEKDVEVDDEEEYDDDEQEVGETKVKGKRSRTESQKKLYRAVSECLEGLPRHPKGWTISVVGGFSERLPTGNVVIVPSYTSSSAVIFQLKGPDATFRFMGHFTVDKTRSWRIMCEYTYISGSLEGPRYTVTEIQDRRRRRPTESSKTKKNKVSDYTEQEFEIVVPVSRSTPSFFSRPRSIDQPVDDDKIPERLPGWFTTLIIEDPARVQAMALEEIKRRAIDQLKTTDKGVREQAVTELKRHWTGVVEQQARQQGAAESQGIIEEYRKNALKEVREKREKVEKELKEFEKRELEKIKLLVDSETGREAIKAAKPGIIEEYKQTLAKQKVQDMKRPPPPPAILGLPVATFLPSSPPRPSESDVAFIASMFGRNQ